MTAEITTKAAAAIPITASLVNTAPLLPPTDTQHTSASQRGTHTHLYTQHCTWQSSKKHKQTGFRTVDQPFPLSLLVRKAALSVACERCHLMVLVRRRTRKRRSSAPRPAAAAAWGVRPGPEASPRCSEPARSELPELRHRRYHRLPRVDTPASTAGRTPPAERCLFGRWGCSMPSVTETETGLAAAAARMCRPGARRRLRLGSALVQAPAALPLEPMEGTRLRTLLQAIPSCWRSLATAQCYHSHE